MVRAQSLYLWGSWFESRQADMNDKRQGDVSISLAQVADIHGIQEVWFQSWLVTYPNEELGVTRAGVEERWKDRHSDEKTERLRRFIERPNDTERIFVAKEEGEIVGLCRVAREGAFNELNALYVAPIALGRGIGTSLWQHTLTFLDTSKPTYVYVATYNERAVAFYQKKGFKDTGGRVTEDRFRIDGIMIPQLEMKAPAYH